MPDLLPCPFCGADDVRYDPVDRCVACWRCDAEISRYDGEASAATAWNRRASPWRLIESAPEYDDVVLARHVRGERVWQWVGPAGDFPGNGYPQPTHWMPIPTLPEEP